MRVKRDLLLHPIRLKIVQVMVKRPMTAGDLMGELPDVAQATLYRHLKALVDGGLLEIVDEQPIRGGVERTYATIESAVMLSYDEMSGLDSDEQFRFFATFVGMLLTDFSTYLERDNPDLEKDRVGYSQAPLWLTTDEFDELASEMGALIEARLSNEPSPGRRRHLLSTIALPGDSSSSSADG